VYFGFFTVPAGVFLQGPFLVCMTWILSGKTIEKENEKWKQA
jgi:hypothetical protein